MGGWQIADALAGLDDFLWISTGSGPIDDLVLMHRPGWRGCIYRFDSGSLRIGRPMRDQEKPVAKISRARIEAFAESVPAEVREKLHSPETVAADVRAVALRAEQAAGQPLIGGQLWGLPVLDGDMWADIAGATAITGKPAKTITSYLVRGKPKSNPFPQPSRFLGRNYWPVSVLTAWAAAATSSDAE